MSLTPKAFVPWVFACCVFLAGCTATAATVPSPTATPITSTPTSPMAPAAPAASGPSVPADSLAVSLLYPKSDTHVEMGRPVKFIARVSDAQGEPVDGAQVAIAVRDVSGKVIGEVQAVSGGDGVYRSDALPIPHRVPGGSVSVAIEAGTPQARGTTSGAFKIDPTTSEILLGKYGFWLDAPSLRGVVPSLVTERGDARNGLIRWGGTVPGMHILPEAFVEIHWRAGDFKLDSAGAVRQFMLGELGDLGFTPIRELGPFERFKFKQWDGWRIGARGQFGYNQVQYVVFYAPEVDKTYAIGTDVALPPAGIDPFAALRDSFAVAPDVAAAGVAPEPLPKRLPAPELVGPAIGTQFAGLDPAPVLSWKPVKELAPDEYYEVAVGYNYREDNALVKFVTRQTQFTLPENLYRAPNCGVFNWQITLMRKTGVDENGQTSGEALSHRSLYWYVWWKYPPGEQKPFIALCPNPQI